jgi:two-component system sensor histidine kinase KdpD
MLTCEFFMLEDKTGSFLKIIRSAQRGRLKVYLGYCAGVGKTYQMLLEGHRLKAEGIDVVIGLVETHGRAETANLIDGLEVVPRLRQEYRGITVEDMDVDAVIARKPQVALIDELAHTNVPGSRNPKRYQDVQDILAAGIHVITTVNVQHLESLYDTVEKSVHVKVRERMPDTVLAEADQIVNVDLTTEDLRKRLEEGKIYPQERIETALSNFFIPSNLEQLRELTLRELASQIDLRRREPVEEESPPTPDQIMVCLSSKGPNSETLLRYASRLAGKLNRNWYAVYVQTPSEEPTAIDAQTQRVLSGTLTLAKQLGAMVFTYRGEDIADTLLRFAREYRVGHIVIGASSPLPFWKKLMGKNSIAEQLIKNANGITIVVLDTKTNKLAAVKEIIETAKNLGMLEPTTHAEQQPALSNFISAARVIIWKEPAFKEEIIRNLVDSIVHDYAYLNRDAIYQAIWQRERESSTFFNEGVAFPHARIEDLNSSIVAIGLTIQGVVDVSTDKPIHLVFLIISPQQKPDEQIQLLALASRASQSRHLIQNLNAAVSNEEVVSTIQSWEQSQKPYA